MSEPKPLTITEEDAMTIVIVAVEAFLSVGIADMAGTDAGAGACVLFDQMMSRIAPLLPRRPEMNRVFELLTSVRATANAYRRLHSMPERQ